MTAERDSAPLSHFEKNANLARSLRACGDRQGATGSEATGSERLS